MVGGGRLDSEPAHVLPMAVDELRPAGLDVPISVKDPALPVEGPVFPSVEYRGACIDGWEFLCSLRISFQDRESGAIMAECLYSADEGAQVGFVPIVDKARKVALKFIELPKSGTRPSPR